MMKKWFFIIISLTMVISNFILVPSTFAETQTAYYVSPSGNDANAGTLAAPFLTIEKARDVVRTINTNMTGNIYIYLRGGTYTLANPIALTQADSGSNGYNVIYKNYPSETPYISGGQTITEWTLFDAGKNIYSASVSSTLETRQIYVNGTRAIRARSTGGLPGAARHYTSGVYDGFTTTDSTMQSWGNKSDIEFVFDAAWTQSRCGVSTIVSSVVTMQLPCFASFNNFSFLVNAYTVPVYYENAYELLDSAGEWYLNRTTHVMYYKPRSGESMATAEVVAAKLETLINGQGTISSPIQNIRFEGLVFEHATWLNPNTSDGFAQVQASGLAKPNATSEYSYDSGHWVKMSANVNFSYANNIQFERNTFIRLGASALDFGKGSVNNTVSGNIFTDISGSAVQVGGIGYIDARPADTRDILKNNQITNNYIHDLAVEYAGCVGIFVGYTDSTTIAHNEISNLPYSGISMGWGWGVEDYYEYPFMAEKSADSAKVDDVSNTVSKNNRVLNNHIHDVMLHLNDGGAIYMLGAQPGTRVEYNVLHDQKNEIGALYFDSGSSYISARNNVMYANKANYVMAPLGFNNDIEFNYHDSASGMQTQDYTYLENNYNIADTGVPAFILDNAGLEASYRNLLPDYTIDLALGKSANMYLPDGITQSTTNNGNEANKAVDGDVSTGTYSNESYAWIEEVDLGAVYQISSVETTFLVNNYATQYDIQVSTTGGGSGSFTTVKSVTGGTGGVDKQAFAATHARYVRIKAIKPDATGQTGQQMVINELKVFGKKVSISDNLALGKTANAYLADGVTVSSTPSGHEANKAIDGNFSTYAESNSSYAWIEEVDLGSNYLLDTVETTFGPGYATQYDIQVSNTGGAPGNFVTVKSVTGGTGGISRQSFVPVSARYVRIKAVKPDGPSQTGIEMDVAEIGIYEVGLESITRTNIALNKTANAYLPDGVTLSSTPAGFGSDQAVDGNPGTYTQSNSSYAWIQEVDLGASYLIDTVETLFAANAFATEYQIQVSTTGGSPSNFTTVKSVTGGTGGVSNQRFTAVNARYVRIKAIKPDGASQTGIEMGVAELRVYAYNNLALSKTTHAYLPDGITTSTTPVGYDSSKAVDGNPSTGTYSNASYAWIEEVDLGAIYAIDTVQTTFLINNYATQYEIQVSTIGGAPGNFTPVRSVTGGTGGVDKRTFTTTNARYVRIKAIKPDATGQTGQQMVINELEVFGNKVISKKVLSSNNLALGKNAKAFLSDGVTLSTTPAGYEPSKAVDDDLASGTESNSAYAWILEVDLGAKYNIDNVDITFLRDGYATAYDIQVSTTGGSPGSFTTVKNVTGNTFMSSNQTFAPVDARYVRIKAVSPSASGQRGAEMDITNVGIYEARPAIVRYYDGLTKNIALAKTASVYYNDGSAASVNTGSEVANGIDGVLATATQTNAQYAWTYQVDFGAVKDVKTILVYFDNTNWATDFEIQTSVIGGTGNFTTVKTFNDIAIGGGAYLFTFPTTSKARYIRIKALKPDASGQVGIKMKIKDLKVTTVNEALKLSEITDNTTGVDSTLR